WKLNSKNNPHMPVRVLPDFLINQIAAGEVVERPASVVKELVENALDAGADQIMIDVADGGRTLITVVDNGSGMSRDDLVRSITRHATSKLPDDDLLNINFMGFRGEALPSIASVSDMTIDTCNGADENGWQLNANTGDVRPSDWDAGTRIRVANLFARTPARLKFLRADRAEMISVLDVVRRLAMARPDVGFTLNNKWRFPKNQNMRDRIVAVMGDDVAGRMIPVDAFSASDAGIELHGFISEPTLRRASSVDQYLFVNGRPVKDKVLVGALRAAYMDVMHAREFPLCALYLTVPPRSVDVNVSPAKTEVHFLEPAHIRGFIIKNLRAALARTMNNAPEIDVAHHAPREFEMAATAAPTIPATVRMDFGITPATLRVHQPEQGEVFKPAVSAPSSAPADTDAMQPLGRAIGQIGNKYILAASGDNLVVVDQHAAHERITYERLRQHAIKTQPLLTPIVVSMRSDDVAAVLTVADEMRASGLHIDAFGDDAIAIFEKPADWDLNWANLFHDIADEIRANGHSSQLGERLHLKLANYACHHSVRAGQALDMASCDALLRAIENTARAGQCNHGRPVYKFIPIADMDAWFERI
ncbi:MAG TPA: DNA mismatch repair endonuclease MutL, partial [Alphaproteobacteria bacterium]|nr:DNA mismatch repair endonuclease MutL [Alphaproteobacteria bacterium]